MSETLIKVENVSKKFCRSLKRSLWYGINDLGVEMFGRKQNKSVLRKDEFWAAENISFEVKRGECLGLIGRNGAGKSTLLKMLNGLINPDKGRIEMHGRTGALIELGTGFNPVLTGKENVYANGTILGFSKKEIREKYDEIVAFAELEEFMDSPLQNYSSGMKVRLGFAVAAQMEPDILLLDEVLAVGDAGFRIKSFNKINELVTKSAVIFVSHSMPHIAMICNKLMLLDKGKSESYNNEIAKGIEKYFEKFEGAKSRIEFNEFAQIENLKIHSNQNQYDESNISVIGYLEDIVIDLVVRASKEFDSFNIKVQISDKDLRIVGIYDSENFNTPILNNKDLHKIRICLNQCIFINGEYAITIFIANKNIEQKRSQMLATYRYFSKFKVRSNNSVGYVPAVVHMPGNLSVIN